MSIECKFDRDEECQHNCEWCERFVEECYFCHEQFFEECEKYMFPVNTKVGMRPICFDCLFKKLKSKHLRDFAEEYEDEYRDFIREIYSD